MACSAGKEVIVILYSFEIINSTKIWVSKVFPEPGGPTM